MQPHPFFPPARALLGLIWFVSQAVFASAAETNFWQERRLLQAQAAPPALLGLSLGAAPVKSLLGGTGAPAFGAGAGETERRVLQALSLSPATIRGIFRPAAGGGARVVVYLQDVHQNADAQKNLGATVKNLAEGKIVGFVGLEGAAGRLPLGAFAAVEDRDALEAAALSLRGENRLSGPAAAGALLSGAGVPFFGVEDTRLYAANVAAFKRFLPKREAAARLLDEDRRRLAARKTLFPPALAQLDAQVQAYHRGELPLGACVRALARGRTVPPALAGFLRALTLEESLDFAAVEKERRDLLAGLLPALGPAEARALADLALAFRAGTVAHGDFYRALAGLAKSKGRDFAGRQLGKYLAYVAACERIDGEELFRGVSDLEDDAFARWSADPALKAVIEASRALALKEKLADFSLTAEEWRSLKPAGLDGAFRPMADFYRLAEKRDAALAENFLKAWPAAGPAAAVLVTGGFHAEGIKRRLLSHGVTVVSVVPRMDSVVVESGAAELGVFAQEKTPLARLQQGEKLFLASPPASPDALGSLAARAFAAAAVRAPAADLRQKAAALYAAVAGGVSRLADIRRRGREAVAVLRAKNARGDVEVTARSGEAGFRFDEKVVVWGVLSLAAGCLAEAAAPGQGLWVVGAALTAGTLLFFRPPAAGLRAAFHAAGLPAPNAAPPAMMSVGTPSGGNFPYAQYSDAEALFKAILERYLAHARGKAAERGAAALRDAFERARRVHSKGPGAVRGDGRDYIFHPLEAALYLVRDRQIVDPAVLIAALLHDTVEDSRAFPPEDRVTIDDIRAEFGERAAVLVAHLTDDAALLGPDASYYSPVTRKRHYGLAARKIEHLDRIESITSDGVRRAVVLIKAAERLQTLFTDDAWGNPGRPMEPESLVRWKIFIRNPAIPRPLRDLLGPALERDKARGRRKAEIMRKSRLVDAVDLPALAPLKKDYPALYRLLIYFWVPLCEFRFFIPVYAAAVVFRTLAGDPAALDPVVTALLGAAGGYVAHLSARWFAAAHKDRTAFERRGIYRRGLKYGSLLLLAFLVPSEMLLPFSDSFDWLGQRDGLWVVLSLYLHSLYNVFADLTGRKPDMARPGFAVEEQLLAARTEAHFHDLVHGHWLDSNLMINNAAALHFLRRHWMKPHVVQWTLAALNSGHPSKELIAEALLLEGQRSSWSGTFIGGPHVFETLIERLNEVPGEFAQDVKQLEAESLPNAAEEMVHLRASHYKRLANLLDLAKKNSFLDFRDRVRLVEKVWAVWHSRGNPLAPGPETSGAWFSAKLYRTRLAWLVETVLPIAAAVFCPGLEGPLERALAAAGVYFLPHVLFRGIIEGRWREGVGNRKVLLLSAWTFGAAFALFSGGLWNPAGYFAALFLAAGHFVLNDGGRGIDDQRQKMDVNPDERVMEVALAAAAKAKAERILPPFVGAAVIYQGQAIASSPNARASAYHAEVLAGFDALERRFRESDLKDDVRAEALTRLREIRVNGLHTTRRNHNGQPMSAVTTELQEVVARTGVSLNGATFVISLGPCLKCAQFMAAAGAKRVVYGINFPNPGGINYLQERGISVTAGVSADRAKKYVGSYLYLSENYPRAYSKMQRQSEWIYRQKTAAKAKLYRYLSMAALALMAAAGSPENSWSAAAEPRPAVIRAVEARPLQWGLGQVRAKLMWQDWLSGRVRGRDLRQAMEREGFSREPAAVLSSLRASLLPGAPIILLPGEKDDVALAEALIEIRELVGESGDFRIVVSDPDTAGRLAGLAPGRVLLSPEAFSDDGVHLLALQNSLGPWLARQSAATLYAWEELVLADAQDSALSPMLRTAASAFLQLQRALGPVRPAVAWDELKKIAQAIAAAA